MLNWPRAYVICGICLASSRSSLIIASNRRYKETIHYVTHYPFMWGAIASTLVCVLLVLPTYWSVFRLINHPSDMANAVRDICGLYANISQGVLATGPQGKWPSCAHCTCAHILSEMQVTLGPFEIAHAFRSPMTAQASSAAADELMRDVGHRQIKYGQIVSGDARGVIGIAEPEYVARIHP